MHILYRWGDVVHVVYLLVFILEATLSIEGLLTKHAGDPRFCMHQKMLLPHWGYMQETHDYVTYFCALPAQAFFNRFSAIISVLLL
jgi:hypothetical protein